MKRPGATCSRPFAGYFWEGFLIEQKTLLHIFDYKKKSRAMRPVSYTHLDVYKRQVPYSAAFARMLRSAMIFLERKLLLTGLQKSVLN